jgi:hypothetical protein
MTLRGFSPLLVCFAAMTASAALAADPPATPVAPVTVEAAKPEELRTQTFNFVQLYAATSVKLGQVARWTQPLCVTVQGLQPQAAAAIKGRVEEVATAMKVGAEKPGCPPNVQIFFTDKPQPLLDKVAKEHELLLGYWHHRDRDKLKAVTHPIQSWYVTGTGGAGGNVAGATFAFVESGGIAVGMAPGPVPQGTVGRQVHGFQIDDETDDRGPTGCGDNPHFTACLSSEFQHVLVVVDLSKAASQPLDSIADYVVMLVMSQPKSLDGCNVLPSVVDLFAKGCVSDGKEGLTRADVAYLTALYGTDLEAKKTGQLTDISGRMADMLLKANASDRLTIQAEDAKGATKK